MIRSIDAMDVHMIRHAAARGPVEVRNRRIGRWSPATLIGWSTGGHGRSRSARVQIAGTDTVRTVRHADVALPEEPDG